MDTAPRNGGGLTALMARPDAAEGDPSGLSVAEAGGVVVARIRDRALVEGARVSRIGRELKALAESGRARVVLDLGEVEDLSAEAVVMLGELLYLCRSGGGLLKLCELRAPLADRFERTGLVRLFAIAPDQRAATEGAWPEAATPGVGAREIARPEAAAPAPSTPGAAPRVRLVAQLGKARGKVVEVARDLFLIGRDSSCHLRPNSPAISRLHTALERRDGRIYVRDLGGKNGTLLNGRALPGPEAEVSDGDRLQVGPLLFAVEVGDHHPAPHPSDSDAPWLFPDRPAGLDHHPSHDPDESTLMLPLPDVANWLGEWDAGAAVEAASGGSGMIPLAVRTELPIDHLAYEVVGDALVVAILPTELEAEAQIAPVRAELGALADRDLPRKVVVALGRVQRLSAPGAVLFLAHFQRLIRAGGSMRLCQANPGVGLALERMRVPTLIDLFSTVEEALRASWD